MMQDLDAYSPPQLFDHAEEAWQTCWLTYMEMDLTSACCGGVIARVMYGRGYSGRCRPADSIFPGYVKNLSITG